MQALSFEAWRRIARPMLLAHTPPAAMDWVGRMAAAAADADGNAGAGVVVEPGGVNASSVGAHAADSRAACEGAERRAREIRLPRRLIQLLENLACYRHPGRWELMYRLAWRVRHGSPRLLQDAADPDVAHAEAMDRAIRRDLHKMHAFVRFSESIDPAGGRSYFAWFEPQHEILRKGAPFFVKRFLNMSWTIATPDGAAVWDGAALQYVDAPQADRRRADGSDDLWRVYYRNICNVARINPAAMQREMPRYYWRNLPEAREIEALLKAGTGRFREDPPVESPGALAAGQQVRHLQAMPDGPQACRRCELWRHATQAVEGQGPDRATLMLVGEQPGDEEDLRGHPFVGPAGRVLDEVLRTAGLERGTLYVTNAVKHFKWEPRGKRRLHKRPDVREIGACQTWLDAEIARVRPRVLVALGATALRSLTGRSMSIESARGRTLTHASGACIHATYHPSAILRADASRAEELRRLLSADLAEARSAADR